MTTLYKLNNRNLISWWKITTNNSDLSYTVSWGQDHQDMAVTENTITTPAHLKPSPLEDQVQSLIDQQIARKGYTRELPDTPPDLPMKAQEWKTFKEKASGGRSTVAHWPSFYYQPKLDGIRCIASPMSLYSRTNKEITSVPHITLIMNTLLTQEEWVGVKLDGELYVPGADLQTIQSAVNRNIYDPWMYRSITYNVFDIVDHELTFEERHKKLKELFKTINHIYDNYVYEDDMKKHAVASCPIVEVSTTHQDTPTDDPKLLDLLYDLNNKFRTEGYEGVMLRNPESLYRPDYRSFDLLKYKDFCDAEFMIVGIEEAKEKCGVFICKTKSGATFKANPAWTRERKQALLRHADNYIGRYLTVKYEKLSKDGIPLKPTGKTLRD